MAKSRFQELYDKTRAQSATIEVPTPDEPRPLEWKSAPLTPASIFDPLTMKALTDEWLGETPKSLDQSAKETVARAAKYGVDLATAEKMIDRQKDLKDLKQWNDDIWADMPPELEAMKGPATARIRESRATMGPESVVTFRNKPTRDDFMANRITIGDALDLDAVLSRIDLDEIPTTPEEIEETRRLIAEGKRGFFDSHYDEPADEDTLYRLGQLMQRGSYPPLRVIYSYLNGRAIGAGDLFLATVKRVLPGDAWTDAKQKKLIDAFDDAMGYDPSGFQQTLAGLAEFIGRITTVSGALKGLGLMPKAAAGKLDTIAQNAKLFGVAATADEASQYAADLIDPADIYSGLGAKERILSATAFGAVMGALGVPAESPLMTKLASTASQSAAFGTLADIQGGEAAEILTNAAIPWAMYALHLAPETHRDEIVNGWRDRFPIMKKYKDAGAFADALIDANKIAGKGVFWAKGAKDIAVANWATKHAETLNSFAKWLSEYSVWKGPAPAKGPGGKPVVPIAGLPSPAGGRYEIRRERTGLYSVFDLAETTKLGHKQVGQYQTSEAAQAAIVGLEAETAPPPAKKPAGRIVSRVPGQDQAPPGFIIGLGQDGKYTVTDLQTLIPQGTFDTPAEAEALAGQLRRGEVAPKRPATTPQAPKPQGATPESAQGEIGRAGQTEEPKTGRPYAAELYRGTSTEGPLDQGIYGKATYYSPDRSVAEHYRRGEGEVVKQQVKLENPFVGTEGDFARLMDFSAEEAAKEGISQTEYESRQAQRIRDQLEAAGHDGFVLVDEQGKTLEVGVFAQPPRRAGKATKAKTVAMTTGADRTAETSIRGEPLKAVTQEVITKSQTNINDTVSQAQKAKERSDSLGEAGKADDALKSYLDWKRLLHQAIHKIAYEHGLEVSVGYDLDSTYLDIGGEHLEDLDVEPLQVRLSGHKQQRGGDVTHSIEMDDPGWIKELTRALDDIAALPRADVQRPTVPMATYEQEQLLARNAGIPTHIGREELEAAIRQHYGKPAQPQQATEAQKPKAAKPTKKSFADWLGKQPIRNRAAIEEYLESGDVRKAIEAYRDATDGLYGGDKRSAQTTEAVIAFAQRRPDWPGKPPQQAAKPEEIEPSIGAAAANFPSQNRAIKRAVKQAQDSGANRYISQQEGGRYAVHDTPPKKGHFTIVTPTGETAFFKQASTAAEDAFDYGEHPKESLKYLSEIDKFKRNLAEQTENRKAILDEMYSYIMGNVPEALRGKLMAILYRATNRTQTKTQLKDLMAAINKVEDVLSGADKKQAIAELKAFYNKTLKAARRGRKAFGALPVRTQEQIAELMEGIDLKGLSAAKEKQLAGLGRTLNDLAVVASGGLTSLDEGSEQLADIDPRILKELARLGKTSIHEMEADDIRALKDRLQLLVHLGELKQHLWLEGRLRPLRPLVVMANGEVYTRKQWDKRAADLSRREKRNVARQIAGLESGHLDSHVQHLTTLDATAVQDLVVEAPNRAQRNQAALDQKAWKYVKDHCGLTQKEFDAIETIKQKVVLGGEEYTLTLGQLMSLYRMTLSEDNLRAIFTTKGLLFNGKPVGTPSADELRAVREIIPQKYRVASDVYRDVGRDVLNTPANEASKALVGTEIFIDPEYFARHRVLDQSVIEGGKWDVSIPIESQGPFQPRTGGTQPLEIRSWTRELGNLIDNMTSYATMAIPLRNARTLLNNPDFAATVRAAGHSDTLKAMATIFRRAQVYRTDSSMVDLAGQKWMNRYARAVLARISTMGTQVMSVGAFKSEIQPRYFKLRDIPRIPGMIAKLKRDPALAQRWSRGRVSYEVGAIFARSGVSHKVYGTTPLLDKPMKMVIAGDQTAIAKGALAAEREILARTSLKRGTPEFDQAVLDRVHYAMRRSQPMWDMLNRSVLSSSRGLPRVFLMFRSARENQLNILQRADDALIKGGSKAEWARDWASVLEANMSVAIWKTLWRAALLAGAQEILLALGIIARRDEDKDTWPEIAKRIALDTPKNLVSLVPYIMPAYELAVGVGQRAWRLARTGKPGYRKQPYTNIFTQWVLNTGDVVYLSADAVYHLATGAEYKTGPYKGQKKWKREAYRAAMGIGESISTVAGIPFSGVRYELIYPFEKALRNYKQSPASMTQQELEQAYVDTIYPKQGGKYGEAGDIKPGMKERHDAIQRELKRRREERDKALRKER